MALKKISEYRAKMILSDGHYKGFPHSASANLPFVDRTMFIVKVDQGVKGRFKKGLVAQVASKTDISRVIEKWRKLGFTQFIIDPFVEHQAHMERYLALSRTRNGIRLLYSPNGGIEIESHKKGVQVYDLCSKADIDAVSKAIALPSTFLFQITEAFDREYMSFLELNPFVFVKRKVHILDVACLVDGAAEFLAPGWSSEDFVQYQGDSLEENRVNALNAITPASLSLKVVNPNGNLFFLLSGGGGSLVIVDEAFQRGAGNKVSNFGEYSGNPSHQETYLYTREIVSLILGSGKHRKRALVIAGGISNFTDVERTFDGIIDALSERSRELKRKRVKVFVRRGGVNEKIGLARIRTFLQSVGLYGSVHGSEAILTRAVTDAINYLDA